MAPPATIVLRSMVSVLPQESGECAHLEEDLTRIGCVGLMSKSWSVKDKKIIREHLTGAPNLFDMTIRCHLEKWSAKKWREAYGFGMGGKGFTSRIDKFIGGKFENSVNLKDGFAVAYYEDAKAKKVLEFFIPILYPEKPTRVTVMVGNTIFGALLGERKIDWGIILQSIVAKLVEGVWKSEVTPIGPYLFHLYVG